MSDEFSKLSQSLLFFIVEAFMQLRMQRISVLALLASAATLANIEAIELGQVDDFQNGTAMGWLHGDNSPSPPTVAFNQGPGGPGDHALRNISTGGVLGASRSIMFNRSQWTGDFLAAGVDSISGMIRVPPSSDDVTLRLAFQNIDGDQFSSEIGFDVPKDNQWHDFSLGLDADSLRQVGGLGSLGDALSSVSEFRLLSNTIGPSWRGEAASTEIYFDNITADSNMLVCDLDGNGTCDIGDIDALVAEIASGGNDPIYDLNGDLSFDTLDILIWLSEAGAANLPGGGAYLRGDANLDGTVDGLDFIRWNENRFSGTGLWSASDWNADGLTDGQDFIIWNENKFMSSNAQVPEPGSGVILVTICLAAYLWQQVWSSNA